MSRTLLIPSQLDKIQWASRQLLDCLEKENWDTDTLFAVRLAVEEALANAIKHGNQLKPSKRVHFKFSLNPGRNEVTITVQDEGRGFTPSNVSYTQGYGLLLIHQFMDEVRYNRQGNQIQMTKRIR